MSTTTSTTTRQHILKAAGQIIQREGVSHLTIEAVAREAGLSKGGVLYHFPSKEALVSGMITGHITEFTHDIEQAQKNEEPGTGQWLRAYLQASDDTVHQEPDPAVCLIAAIATNPELLAPLRQSFDQWQEQAMHDGLSPAMATVLRLAIDGLWFADLFKLAPPQGELRQEVLEMLRLLTRSAQSTSQ